MVRVSYELTRADILATPNMNASLQPTWPPWALPGVVTEICGG